MDLRGKNIVVIDVETAKSANDCRHCGKENVEHYGDGACEPWSGEKPGDHIPQFSPIGWDNHAALCLALGCCYWYATDRYTFFDQGTLYRFMLTLVNESPVIVTFNGQQFDLPLLLACLDQEDAERASNQEIWSQLITDGYDLLAEIWKVDPDRKFERGLNSLDALSQANGLGAKEMDGAKAPVLWRQGRYAEVATYNLGDVWRTKKLFEQVVETGQLVRGDGRPITLSRPVLRREG